MMRRRTRTRTRQGQDKDKTRTRTSRTRRKKRRRRRRIAYLRDGLEDKGRRSCHHVLDRDPLLVRHVAKDGEDTEAGEELSRAVGEGNHSCVGGDVEV